jgi:hypothetical protein
LEAGRLVGLAVAKVRAAEQGTLRLPEDTIAHWLAHYGIDPAAHKELLAGGGATRGPAGEWWCPHPPQPGGVDPFTAALPSMRLVRMFAPTEIPPVLQTRAYAHAAASWNSFSPAVTSASPAPPDEFLPASIRALPAAPLPPPAPAPARRGAGSGRSPGEGSHVVGRDREEPALPIREPQRLWVVLDEAALRRPVGSAAIMRAQLKHLIALGATPEVTLQVTTAGGAVLPLTHGPFTMIRFDNPELPDVVHLPQYTGSLFLERRDDAEQFLWAWGSVALAAQPCRDSTAFLKQLHDGWT